MFCLNCVFSKILQQVWGAAFSVLLWFFPYVFPMSSLCLPYVFPMPSLCFPWIVCVPNIFAVSVRGNMFGVALVSLWCPLSLPYVFPMSSLCFPWIVCFPKFCSKCEGERVWCGAVNTNTSPKWQVGTLNFPLRFLIINRTKSDLHRPSVHHPPWLPLLHRDFHSHAGTPKKLFIIPNPFINHNPFWLIFYFLDFLFFDFI